MDGGIKPDLVAGCGQEEEQIPLPDYLVNTYTWAYLRPSSVLLLDNPFVVSAILWGNFSRLLRAACKEFRPGQRVLQAASVYGSLSSNLAETVGCEGRLEVIDIAPIQVENCRRKLASYPQASVRVADAAAPGGGFYDGVCCFFLLHEIPDDQKRAVVDALLRSVVPGGKVVFVDYHRSWPLHPTRMVMEGVFRWLEPYAHGLIRREIKEFAADPEEFRWRKDTYFGGLYQKVVAERKS
jgi:SAM-dependent methyltransferase